MTKPLKMATELFTYENTTGDATARRFIRDGIAGNYDVVFEMVRVIRNSNKDNRIKNIAAELLLSRNLDSYSDAERILRVIFNYVKDNVSYVQDVAGSVESVKSAYRTLFDKFGDCDDLTVTLCSLAGVLGFENVNITLAKYSASDASFSHVYAVVYDNNGIRYPLDASLPFAEFGREIKPFEVKEINVFDAVAGIDGISGIWKNLQHTGKVASKAVLNGIPNLINYLPLGFLSASALSTGANLLSYTGSKTKSLSETATLINKKLDEIINDLVNSQIALDLAQSEAVKIASQLSLVSDIESQEIYKIIKQSINEKLIFIKNFEAIAKINGWRVVYLNQNAMMLLGVTAGTYGAWKLYRLLTRGKE